MSTEILVDGNGLACRLWWGSPSGVPKRFRHAVEAVKGPAYPATVAWDAPGRTWRHDLFPQYKAGRRSKPKLLLEAIRQCQSVFPGWAADGFEADDVIATLLTERPIDYAIVISDDKDLAQLVSERTWLVDGGGRVQGVARIEERYGVTPDRIRHLLSWTGDDVDGLPGMPNYGPKRGAARAMRGEIGNQLTYDLTELAWVPSGLMRVV